jgi:endonuclease/exonuclease/phosphatase (EEP) superfamily protein YafD
MRAWDRLRRPASVAAMTLTSEVRAARGNHTTTLWWLMVSPAALWATGRLLGVEFSLLVQLFSFTPYVAALSLVPLLAAVAVRRWWPAAVAGVAAVVLAGCVLPRAVTDVDRGPQQGTPLRILTANLLAGEADTAQLVGLVRDQRVDVLALQEFTPGAERELDAAGLAALLPHRVVAAEEGVGGSALYARYPLTATGSRRNGGGFIQAHGTVAVPGAPPVLVESVHPKAPSALARLHDWRGDLAAQPRATPDGPLRMLIGDFNATLDHAPLRDLIGSGYRDAADAVGDGLVGTWGPYTGYPFPPITIDHVLVDERIGVTDVSVHDLTGSDHRPVFAAVALPAG